MNIVEIANYPEGTQFEAVNGNFGNSIYTKVHDVDAPAAWTLIDQYGENIEDEYYLSEIAKAEFEKVDQTIVFPLIDVEEIFN